jgi:hypothetical protein
MSKVFREVADSGYCSAVLDLFQDTVSRPRVPRSTRKWKHTGPCTPQFGLAVLARTGLLTTPDDGRWRWNTTLNLQLV